MSNEALIDDFLDLYVLCARRIEEAYAIPDTPGPPLYGSIVLPGDFITRAACAHADAKVYIMDFCRKWGIAGSERLHNDSLDLIAFTYSCRASDFAHCGGRNLMALAAQTARIALATFDYSRVTGQPCTLTQMPARAAHKTMLLERHKQAFCDPWKIFEGVMSRTADSFPHQLLWIPLLKVLDNMSFDLHFKADISHDAITEAARARCITAPGQYACLRSWQ